MKKYGILLIISILTIMLIAGCGGGGGSTGVIPNNGSVTTIDPTATPGTLVEVPGNPTATPGSTIPSNLPTGTFKVEVQFPGSGSGLRAKELAGSDLPYNSHTLRVTITGEAIATSIVGERNDLDPTGAGTYTLTVSNVPVGLNTATIEVLDPSGNLLCQRKHGFYMTPGATEGPGLILLGVAIQSDGSYVPQNIDIPQGSSISFQNHDYTNDRTASMNSGAVTAGPIGHATHITQPVTAEVFPAINNLFNTQGQFDYDGQTGRVLVYGLPTLTSVTPDKDSTNGTTDVSFTLAGTNFGTSQASVNGAVRFIQVNENDPNNPWGAVYNPSSFASWSNTSIAGTINLPTGKYRIEVSVRGENTTETVFFYKGTGTYQVIVGEPVEMVLIHHGTYNLQGNIPVTLTEDFYIGKYEVKNKEYRLWPDAANNHQDPSNLNNPAYDNYPVRNVTYDNVIAYCNWLSETTGKNYRLPTEAEWEYACRAGTTTDYFWGENYPPANIGNYCWYNGNGATVQSVGQKLPNNWGLYDTNGNLWEWCSNWWATTPIGGTDPTGPTTGTYRVVRGGWACDNANVCRSSGRTYGVPSYVGIGFRLARD